MKGQQPIIVKKIKKYSAGGHGGSWKVAYADFITAMMAFFLLMWLISMVSPEKRARVASYFRHFTIFDQGGSCFMDKSSEIFDERGE
ncbi:MAG: chemotaxis protein, partial [Nitrospirae bacterium]|nr:chemotaxis protein [Nitrospirota bacterium]